VTLDQRLIKKILVIKLRAIGDVLLSTVVLKSLRSALPDAELDFLTERQSREVVEGNPAVSSSIIFDVRRDSSVGLILKIRRKQYDLVIDLFGNPRSALIALFSRARYRVGYRFGWRKYCYNLLTEPRGNRVHNVDFNLDALRRIGIPITDSQLTFPVTPAADGFAKDFFQAEKISDKFVIALNPGGGWLTKRWRIRHFAQLGDMLAHELKATILVVWGPGEEQMAGEIRSLMHHPAALIPPCSLKQLAAILSRCGLLVTNDSGPMHIAAAVGTPVVAIFGPTNPVLQGPLGVPNEVIQNQNVLCLGCNFTTCPIGNPCMEELPAESVFAGVQRLVSRNSLAFQNESAE
jgi:lipopolysaccharide heptosyltransferase II